MPQQILGLRHNVRRSHISLQTGLKQDVTMLRGFHKPFELRTSMLPVSNPKPYFSIVQVVQQFIRRLQGVASALLVFVALMSTLAASPVRACEVAAAEQGTGPQVEFVAREAPPEAPAAVAAVVAEAAAAPASPVVDTASVATEPATIRVSTAAEAISVAAAPVAAPAAPAPTVRAADPAVRRHALDDPAVSAIAAAAAHAEPCVASLHEREHGRERPAAVAMVSSVVKPLSRLASSAVAMASAAGHAAGHMFGAH